MSEAVSRIFAHPLRAACVNIVLLVVLLGLAGSGDVTIWLGAAVLAFGGANFIIRIWRAPRTGSVFGLALTWVPGMLALALLPIAVVLASTGGAGLWLGLALMTVELALLAVATIEADHAARTA